MINFKNGLFSCALLMGCMLPLNAAANEKAVTLSAGGGAGAGAAAGVFMVEYEHALTNSLSVAGRGAYLAYTYDSGDDYEEDGSGPGAQVSVKFYPGHEALHGFYFGGGLGMWSMDVDWTEDKGYIYETKGSLTTTSADVHAEVGWRIGKRVQFVPSVQLGHFLSSEIDLGAYLSVNLGIGFAF
jgi:hypothetical protein